MTTKKISNLQSEGRQQLVELIAGGVSQRAVSAALAAAGVGVSQPAIYYWTRGRTRPDVVRREALHRLFGIRPEAWLTDEERALVDALPPGPVGQEVVDLLAWPPLHTAKTAAH
jgi:transcriptional regulator with XRE-family HTH domain